MRGLLLYPTTDGPMVFDGEKNHLLFSWGHWRD